MLRSRAKAFVASHAARLRNRWQSLATDYGPALARFEGPRFLFYASLLILASALLRPILALHVSEAAYQAPIVFVEIAEREIDAIRETLRAQRIAVPAYLFPLIPTVLLLAAGQRIRWERFDSGLALRGLMMTLIVILAWASAMFDYNMYLNTGHWLDRLLLIGLAIASWRWPLAVPFFATHALVLMREVNAPLYHDDFDFRPLPEILFVFSAFVWLSFLRGIRTRHFLFVSLCLLGSYYYQAGVTKVYYGGETWAWLNENHVSNIAVSAYTHGWLNYVPESWFLRFAGVAHRLDYVNQAFTLLVELGALVLIHVHPRLTRFWLLSAAVLHIGIFAFAGIFFWKWIVTDVALWYFVRRGGKDVHRQLFRSWMIPVFGIFLIYASERKTYFNPQIGVGWFDTRVSELYDMHAVGESGESYPINDRFFAPYDTRLIQEDFCFLSKDDRRLTSVYGTTASLELYRVLENAHTPADVDEIAKRYAGHCFNENARNAFDLLISTTFANINRARGRKHRWLHWLGRPDHLRGDRFPAIEPKEPIRKVEVWRTRVFYDGHALHRFERAKVHEVVVP